MYVIIIALIIAVILFGRRGYNMYRTLSAMGGLSEVKLNLSRPFYLEQLSGLVLVSVFLYALHPVDALIAVAAVAGYAVNLFIAMIWYSLPQKDVVAEKGIAGV